MNYEGILLISQFIGDIKITQDDDLKKLEKKAKKATQKAVHMAESVSKKRIKNQKIYKQKTKKTAKKSQEYY